MDLTAEQNKLLNEWKSAKTQLDLLAIREMELRNAVVAAFFQNPDDGTNTTDLPFGWKLKYVKKNNYNLGKNEAVDDALDRIAALGNEGKFIKDRIVGWTPKLMLSEYKIVDAKYKAIIDEVLTIKPAAAELKLVEPNK